MAKPLTMILTGAALLSALVLGGVVPAGESLAHSLVGAYSACTDNTATRPVGCTGGNCGNAPRAYVDVKLHGKYQVYWSDGDKPEDKGPCRSTTAGCREWNFYLDDDGNLVTCLNSPPLGTNP